MPPDVVDLRERRIEANLSELRDLSDERMRQALSGELACHAIEENMGNAITMTIRAPTEVVERAERLVDYVRGPMITAITGGRVSRSMVLRIALLEGLQVLEERYGPIAPAPPATRPQRQQEPRKTGPDALAQWLEDKGLSQAQAAKMLGVNQSVVSQWKTGKLTPKDDQRARLFEVAGIPAECWVTND